MIPRSLVGRMTALVVLLGVFSLALHLALLSSWMQPLADDLGDNLVARVRLEREWLAATPAAERAALAQRLSGAQHRLAPIEADEPGFPGPPPPPRLPGRVFDALRDLAAPEIDVRLAPGSEPGGPAAVWFDFGIDGQRWRAEHRVQPPVLGAVGTGVGWLALIGLSVIVSLVLGVRLISRPLQRLAAQIGAQRGGLQRLQPGPRASTEVLTVVDSFNRLVEAVQRADAVKQQMLAGVSHDLRTPLARLRLRIETQCEPLIAEELGADLHAIERIVSQFLAYVQGDGASALGRRAPLAELVEHVVGSYASQGEPVRTARSDVAIEAPDLPVQRALSNLIDNALSHGLAPVDVVLATRLSPRGEEVMLAVYDRGTGMTDAEFERAQQPFVRLAGANPELGHCGLGLAIVAQMARQLGTRLEMLRDAQGRFGIALVWPDGLRGASTA